MTGDAARRGRGWSAAALALALAACATPGAPPPARLLGPMAAEVGPESAVLWARGDRSGRLHARVAREDGSEAFETSVPLFATDDFTGHIELRGLRPATAYRYRLRFVAAEGDPAAAAPVLKGRFRTAPPEHEAAPVRLAFGGDLAGQNVCRDAREGFPIFRAVARSRPDLFVGLGDMIYADGVCTEVGAYGNPQIPGGFGPATRLEEFWAHWRYAREDPAFAALLASTPYVAVWDDHEVVNDFGPHDDRRSEPPYQPEEPLMPLGLAAFLDYNPIPGRDAASPRLYRSLRWGRHLELFVLDTRQHRDASARPDAPEAPKSMLGEEQREWLLEALARSDATWKVVVTSVPLSVPTGRPEARDGWANFRQAGGYERELVGILARLRDAGVSRTLWLTTDVHFAAVFRYAPFPETPGFGLHEVVTGPLQAGVFGNDRFDETLRGERLFAHRPDDFRQVATWEEARRYFSFGLLDVDASGRLAIRILDADGRSLYELALE